MTSAPPPAASSLSRALQSLRAALTPTVVALGVVSLLNDAASDMIWPLLPLFIVQDLHRSVSFVGLIEGVAEGTASLGKYIAGRYSDRIEHKKPFVLWGYGVSSLMRPLLAFATSPWHALFIRFGDRVGKGVRTAPRDALLAATTTPSRRGTAFGFHRAMDNFGAFIGPLVATVILAWRPHQYRLLFLVSAIPGLISLIAIVALVRDQPAETRRAPSATATRTADPGHGFRVYLVIVALFTLANASDFFLVARAHDAHIPDRWIPALWGGLSLLRAIATTPGGALADRIGRTTALTIGWLLYAVAYVGFGIADGPWSLLVSALVYAAYYGLTEGTERALVASLAPRESLGRAYGAFALVTGLAAVPASAGFGLLYRFADGRYAFFTAAGISAAAAVALFVWSSRMTHDAKGDTDAAAR